MAHYMLPLHNSLHDPLHDPLHVSSIHYMADYTSHYITNYIVHYMIHYIVLHGIFSLQVLAAIAPKCMPHAPGPPSHSPAGSGSSIVSTHVVVTEAWGFTGCPPLMWVFNTSKSASRLGLAGTEWNSMRSNNHASRTGLVTTCGRTKANIQWGGVGLWGCGRRSA